MEYILGSILTLISLYIFSKITKNITGQPMPIPQFSQSKKFQLVKEYIYGYGHNHKKIKTQSTEYKKKNSVKAFFWGENVYWIDNGFLVTAKLTENGIDESTKKRVDTHALDKVELDKMIFIVDKLTEGNKDDSGNSGK